MIVGSLIGCVICVSNLYFGFKTGMTLGGSRAETFFFSRKCAQRQRGHPHTRKRIHVLTARRARPSVHMMPTNAIPAFVAYILMAIYLWPI